VTQPGEPGRTAHNGGRRPGSGLSRPPIWLAGLALAIVCPNAHAVECRRAEAAGKSATVCRVDAQRERLRLFLRDPSGQPLQTFAAVDRTLDAKGERLVFAMNAGMFHADYSPVGLLIQDGRQIARLNTGEGSGNFFLKPNGVFFVATGRAGILEAEAFSRRREPVSLATQSGPLLVRAGAIHPQLDPRSTSRLIRNGVGIDRSGTVVFAISDDPMSFYEFAMLFRDVLQCPDALYFDGVVSSLHAPGVGRSIQRAQLGPIIGVVADK
jgi:uncharacterized protein YigE (DUF2233 family)